ncbi:hypothetical protein TWF694_002270 [Orbilia ellipsospora]|uniref:Uncharacterized protein n=1 Tax=Orbilia ellipsospora TaxID=2528407 RepID=A0AAV9X7L2_9PEZI
MPSFASFSSNPLTIGKGKAQKSYPPVSMKAPSLPETPHLDTSDLLYSVQSVPSPLERDYNQEYQEHIDQSRPAWHTNSPYTEPGFVGGHQYKVERQEERRRLRSLGLLSGSSTPQSEIANTLSSMATSGQKPDARRRSSWQPPLKGKLQKRNKSREPDASRKSLDLKNGQFEAQPIPPPPSMQQQQQHHHSFSRLQSYPPSSVGSPCATPSPGVMASTREFMQPNTPFAHGRSNSSLGTMNSTATLPSPSLGNLVDFYDPNSPLLSPGQAFSTAPSSPIAPLNSQLSSSAPSPIGFHRPRYQSDSPVPSAAISPLLAAQNLSTLSVTSSTTAKKQVQLSTTPQIVNSSTTSLSSSTTGAKPTDKQPEKSGFQPYQPKYAAKSHVTSTVPLAQSSNQDAPATPFVHLDFTPPPKPFARATGENRKTTATETRLTTQEAKEYQAIAQATREAYINRTQPQPEIPVPGKSNGRLPLAPSKLSFEVRNASSPDLQGGKTNIPPKSILRKPVEPLAEDVKPQEEPPRRQTLPYPVQTPSNPAIDPIRVVSNPTKSEPTSPITTPTTATSQQERGRSAFKRGEDQQDTGLFRKSSTSARKSIEVETPSARNFDISKYTQGGASKGAPTKQPKSYPPVSFKRPVTDETSTPTLESPVTEQHIPPVPPLPESVHSSHNSSGLITPPPIRYESAIESSDEESVERPSTATEAKRAGKSKLSSSVSVIENAPVRSRAPSMSDILKELYKHGSEGPSPHTEATENPDWLSQLFRTKKQEAKSRPKPINVLGTPPSSGSPPLSKYASKENESRRSSRVDLSPEGQKVHERAERQRLEVERKLMEAESEPYMTPRSSPRLPRPSVSVTASPDLRMLGPDTASLRSTSTTSVDRLDPVVGNSLQLGRVEQIPSTVANSSTDDKKERERKKRPTSAEVRQRLGEMTPPHERDDWEITRNSQASFSSLNLPGTPNPPSAPASPSIPLPLVINKPVPGRLPVSAEPFPLASTSASTPPCPKDTFAVDRKSSNCSLISLDVSKTLTRILVVCCNCNRLHDPPSDIYRKMAQGNSSFRCPYCIHAINVLECCSAYTSICNLIEKLN